MLYNYSIYLFMYLLYLFYKPGLFYNMLLNLPNLRRAEAGQIWANPGGGQKKPGNGNFVLHYYTGKGGGGGNKFA